VRHFGDLADGQNACGICDFCAPSECVGQTFRPATEGENAAALRVVEALRSSGSRSTGKLHSELEPEGGMTRDEFEEVLGALARAGLIRLADAVFEKEGRSIPYRKANLTQAAEDLDEAATLELLIKERVAAAVVPRKRKTKKKAAASKRQRARKPATTDRPEPAPRAARPETAPDARIEDALRRWRLAEAKRRGVPAFRIFSDQALKAVAEKRPGTTAQLLAIPGIGISTVEKYGAQIYRILHESRI
jgi:superfamily II DNA helicase RecQ